MMENFSKVERNRKKLGGCDVYLSASCLSWFSMVMCVVRSLKSTDVDCILGSVYCMSFSAMASRSFGSSCWKSESISPELL